MSKENKIPQQDLVKPTQEPKSAHATPVVEKYIETRNTKADEQIKNEDQGNSHAE